MITTDLHARLSAALGPDIPVLLPEQLRKPLEAAPLDARGRPSVTGGERGLGAYLKAHPGGYVQIEPLTPLPSGSDGIQQRIWATISTNAATQAASQELYERVHFALCGIPGREPGYYTEKQVGVVTLLSPGVWQTRLTLTRPVIGGRI